MENQMSPEMIFRPACCSATRLILMLLVAATLAATRAEAQVTKPLVLGIGAGFTIPGGDLARDYSTGYHVVGSMLFQQRPSPISLRVDGSYSAFDHEVNSGRVGIWGLSGNAVVTQANQMGPYLAGGAGVYSRTTTGALGGTRSKTELGVNVGGGFRFALSGFDAYAQASWLRAGDNVTFVPLVFGVLF
jgi:hypothetical protein